MGLYIKKNKTIFILSCFLISLIVGHRGRTPDTLAYYNVFKNIDSFNLTNPIKFYISSGMEIGFGWYSYFISLFTDSSIFLFSLFSFLTFYFIYKIAEKIPRINYTFVLLLYLSSGYFLIQQFMQIRQGIAVSIALYAILLFMERHKKTFLLYAIIAFSLHQITIPLLAVGVLLNYINITEKLSLTRFKLFSFFAIIFIFFFSSIFLKNILIHLSDKLYSYSNTHFGNNVGLFRLPNIKAFLTFLFILLCMNEKLYKNRIFITFYILFILGVSFRLGFYNFAILSGRFAISFTFSEIFILPFIFERFGKLGFLLFFIFILIQGVATYVFQAPDVFNNYFNPL